MVVSEQGPHLVAMTVAEAAMRLRLSTEAVRARIRRGRLEIRRGNEGRKLVLVPRSQLEAAEAVQGTDLVRTTADDGADGERTPNGLALLLERELDRLRSELERTRTDAEAWRRKAEENGQEAVGLRGELGRAEMRAESITAVAKGEVEAAKRVAASEVESMREQLEAGVAARNAVIEELRAELARLRLPFWRRWLGRE